MQLLEINLSLLYLCPSITCLAIILKKKESGLYGMILEYVNRSKAIALTGFISFFFKDKILLYRLGWPSPLNPPASASCVLGFQMCATMLGFSFSF
jgi:hypothetical protein